jgi:hypothetical protein
MSKENNMIVENEHLPIAEIKVGNEHKQTEINFHSGEALEIKYLWKICSLLEKHGYDESKLEITSDEISSHVLGHKKDGKIIFAGEKSEVDYSLKYDNLDGKTKNKIEKLLRSIPYVKIET